MAIKAVYDPKSVIEEDNYVNWNYYTDFSKIYSFAQMLTLTGNSTHRVQQLYLTNPNTKYPVYLDIMAAVIDDQYSFFQDITNQSGLSFTGLRYTDIVTHVVDESIAIMSNELIPTAIAYIMLANINSLERLGRVVIIDDAATGRIFLEFLTDYDAVQALSLLNWVMEEPGRIIQNLSPIEDTIIPVIYFTPLVYLIGSTSSGTFSTLDGNDFAATMSLTTHGTASEISISNILYYLVDSASDNRDGVIVMTNSNINLFGSMSLPTTLINTTGTYSVTFDLSDIAENYVISGENILITVIP